MGEADPTIRVHAVVEGRVQGVWYRQSCREQALANHVTGWVRNNDNGNVEAVLEGESTAVMRVLEWMRKGPPAALVTRVRANEEIPRGEQGFSVR
jgi:acylphosphatase